MSKNAGEVGRESLHRKKDFGTGFSIQSISKGQNNFKRQAM